MKALLSIAVSTATFFAARCDSSKTNQQSTIPDAAIAAAPSPVLRDAAEQDAQPSASSSSPSEKARKDHEEHRPRPSLFRPWRNAVPTPSISPAPGFTPSSAQPAQPSTYEHHPLHAGSLSGFAQSALLSPLGL